MGPTACVKLTHARAATPQADVMMGLDAIAAVVRGGTAAMADMVAL